MLRSRFLHVLLALLAAGWCAAGQADDEPRKADPKPRLTTEALGEMLTNMGYEPKLVDKKFHSIAVESRGRSWSIWVSVTDDGRVQLLSLFNLRDDFEKAPTDAWRKVLEKNEEIAPAAFGLEKKFRRLTLRKSLGDGITPAQLRKEFTAFADTIVKTEPLWRPTAFLPPHTPAAQKLLDSMAGTWVITAGTLRGAEAPAAALEKLLISIDKNEIWFTQDGQEKGKAVVYLMVGAQLTTLDMINEAGTDLGILKLEKDTLTICYVIPTSGSPRPTDFESTEKNKATLLVLKRKKP